MTDSAPSGKSAHHTKAIGLAVSAAVGNSSSASTAR